MSQNNRQQHPCKDCQAETLYYSLRECPWLGRDMAIEGCNHMYARTEKKAWRYIDEELGDEERQAYYAQKREQARIRQEKYGA